MKKLIFAIMALVCGVCSAYAGEMQEMVCGDKNLSYCIKHFDRQCSAKNHGACRIVGDLHYEQKQYSESKKYYELVCDKANSKDSYQLELINGGLGNKVPAIISMKLACGELARYYYEGLGVRQDFAKALQYYKKACGLGYAFSCASAGDSYHLGEGVRQDFAKALQYYKKACGLGNADSCTKAGGSYLFGKGTKKDFKLAKSYYEKACEMESAVGCFGLGVMYHVYHGGKSVPQNLSKAKELYGKACDLGNQDGCDNYKKLNEKGVR